MLNDSVSYKTSIAGNGKEHSPELRWKKKIQPGTCGDYFGTEVYLSSGKGLLLAISDIGAEK